MKPDSRDIELLRLTGKFRWLPFDVLGKFGFINLPETVGMLSKLGYISISRNKRYFMPAQKGLDMLSGLGYAFDTATNRAYSGSITLRRRLDAASIMLTALRAGIDTLRDDVDSLKDQPVFLPSFAFRSASANPMSNSTCAGFGHWGNKAYMLHYISPESNGMFLMNELKTFHNLSSVFSTRLDEPEAMVFAGGSYTQVYEQITQKAQSKNHGIRGFADFADVYKRVDLPIHLLSCDEAGAVQLALMRQPAYNARLAHTAFGNRWVPRDEQIPEADGLIDGDRTLLIAADMDIRRAGRVVEDAKRLGKKGVALVAFKEQLEGLLMHLFPRNTHLVHLQIKQPVLDAAFGKGFSLYSPGGEQEGSDQHG